MDEAGKVIIKKLREWGGDLAKEVGKKCKRTKFYKFSNEKSLFNLNKGSEFEKTVKEPQAKKSVKPVATPGPVFTRKEIATLAQQIEILDWHNKNGKNQSKTARHFNPIYPNLKIKQPLVSTWVNDETKWREQWEKTNCQGDRTAKRA